MRGITIEVNIKYNKDKIGIDHVIQIIIDRLYIHI